MTEEDVVPKMEQSFRNETYKMIDENCLRCKICGHILLKQGVRGHIRLVHGEEAYYGLIGDEIVR